MATWGRPRGAELRRLRSLLALPATDAARALIGQILVRPGKQTLAVRIVETEAYLGAEDPSAHASHGRTSRTEPLFGPPGTLYVYFIYGMHHCLNFAVDRPGVAGSVLVRAAEPLPRTPLAPESCKGPGRLCRALGIDVRHSGESLFAREGPLFLREGTHVTGTGVSPRIGIRHASSWPLRFFDPGSAAVSGRPAGASKRSARGKGRSGNRIE